LIHTQSLTDWLAVVVDEGDVCQSALRAIVTWSTLQVDLQVWRSYFTDSESTTRCGIEMCILF